MFKTIDLGRSVRILLLIVLISLIIWFGRQFLTVIIFSGLLAMLMTPVSNFLENHKSPRVLSSLISVLIIVVVFSVFLLLIVLQIENIREQFQTIRDKFSELGEKAISWADETFSINIDDKLDSLKDQSSQAMRQTAGAVAGLVKGIFSFIGSFLLVLVFTFLFLLRREKYENFVVMLYDEERQDQVREIVGKISKISQQYLGGRIISISILLVLYLIGFTIVGLKNAFVLASIAALVTFIPYVGPFLGGIVPVIMAFVTGSLNQALWITVVIVVSQLFQNYFIEPTVVGGSVNISPFFTILILLAGGMVWGIAGIILFLPLLGILRIIFENVSSMQPYAYLIGDQKESKPGKFLEKFRSWFGKKERK